MEIEKCEQLLKVMETFYDSKFNKKAGTQPKKVKKDKDHDESMYQESTGPGSSEKNRKLKDLMIKFLSDYVSFYFVNSFEQQKNKDIMSNLGTTQEGLTAFAMKYLPMTVVSMKSRTKKTRDNSKKLLLGIDKAYEFATNDKSFLLNLVIV